MENKLLRIGVFYDGNYFFRASSYYAYGHSRKTRLSISGLHDFIRHHIATETKTDVRLCQIVDAHYFRGRLSAFEASQRGDTLYWDRVFDDILMSEGVTTHYLPVKTVDGQKQEKGIDVLLALEAFEMALYKKFDVLVLIASDGDYVPLIRKLNTLSTRVMVLSWDFEYTDDSGRKFTTRTSQDLLEEVTYPVAMHEIIDNRLRRNEPLINNLFVQSDFRRPNNTYRSSFSTGAITPNTNSNSPVYDPVVDDFVPVNGDSIMDIIPASNIYTDAPRLTANNNNNPLTNPLHTPPANIQPPIQNPIHTPLHTPAQNQNPVVVPNTVIPPVQQVLSVEETVTVVNTTPPPVVQVQPVEETTMPAYTPTTQQNNQLIFDGVEEGEVQRGEILSLKDGYGFIKYKPNNLFFHYSDMIAVDFNELSIGDFVEFVVGYKEDGRGFATNVRLFE
jgi:uncharacterized LabA/DUF88 family protein/cold shock CspA family protein